MCYSTSQLQDASVHQSLSFKVLLILFITGISIGAQGQMQLILDANSDGQTFSTCSGELFDSGGLGTDDYSNNENYTITICPDQVGELTSIEWTAVDLSTNDDDPDPNQENLDYINIWDGNAAIGAPSIGSFSGTSLGNIVTTASITNPSGCLTIQFISNTLGTGQFEAQITCQEPCAPPEAFGEILNADNLDGDSIAVCVGELVEFSGYALPEPGFSIDNLQWNFGDGTIDNSNNGLVDHAFTQSGHYVVELIATDDNGCENINSISLNVYVSTFPTFIPFVGDTSVCLINGGFNISAYPALYAAAGSFSPVFGLGVDSSYWDPSGTDITNISANGNVATIVPTSQGSFDYTYTISNNFGCTFDSTITVTVTDHQVQASIIGSPVFCDGTGAITASQVGNPSGLFVYSWSPTTGLSNPGQANTVVNLFQDTMIYTVTSYPIGVPSCATTAQVMVMLDPLIDAGYDASLTVCWNDGIFTLSETFLGGTPDPGGEWTDPIGNVITDYDPGLQVDQVLTYTVTNPVTGCFKSSELSIHVNPIGSAVCCNFDVYTDTLSASCASYADGYIEVWVDGLVNSGPYDFTFLDQIGTPISMLPLDNMVSDTIFNLTAGEYQVQISIPAPNYCPIFDTITVNEPGAILTNPFADTSICIGGVATLSAYASGGNGGFIHHWTTPQGTTFDTYPYETITVDTLTFDPTSYTVVTEDSNNCLSNPKYPKVDIFPPISIAMDPDTQICVNTPLILHPTNVAGGAYTVGDKYEVYSFFWFDENGVALQSSGDSLSLIPTEEAMYYLSVVDTCSTPMKTDSIYVHFYTQPNTAFTSDTTSGCYPTGIQFINLTDPNLLVGSLWNFGDGEYSSEDEPYHVYTGTGYYTVSLQVVSPDGCYTESIKTNYIRSNGYPNADFEYFPLHPTMLNPQVTFVNLSNDNLSNYWEFEEGYPSTGTSVEENPVFLFPNTTPGVYPVYLQVSNETNCVHDTIVNVTIYEDFAVFLPNSFTPNGDGYNDVFGPVGTDLNPNDYSMQIYDRWGELVFKTTNLEEPWNGAKNNSGELVQEGVYVYRMVIRSATTYGKKEISGDVLVIQ